MTRLHLPRPRRLQLPDRLAERLLGGIPGLGKDTWTPEDTSAGRSPLSLFEPVYLGCDLYGDPVFVTLAYRNLFTGGVADSGKSNGAAQVIAHAALCLTCVCGSSTASGSSWASGSRSRNGSSVRSYPTRSTP